MNIYTMLYAIFLIAILAISARVLIWSREDSALLAGAALAAIALTGLAWIIATS